MSIAEQDVSRKTPRIDPANLEKLRSGLRGRACLQGEAGYDEARTIWNAMIDRSPDLVVRCTGAADVIRAVRFANEHDLAIAVRSGGENPDLFWAIRGGGGNFGIVVSFEFNLHPLGPEVFSGLLVHPFAKAEELLKGYQRVVAAAPEALTVWAVMRKAPPLPFIPAEWHGKEVLIFAACYAGSNAEGEKAVAPLRALGQPIADVLGPHPLVGWQAAFDPLLTPGARNYWKTHDFTTLSDEAIGAITKAVGNLPGPECEVFIAHVGGAMSRVPPGATAYPHRNAHFIMNVHTRWREAAQDRACIDWARACFQATAPFATGGAYINFMPADESDRVEKVYGPNYGRLAEAKRRWDPQNRFRLNQNIRPTA
jgi:FAD/FMN-containing dehydrogenase